LLTTFYDFLTRDFKKKRKKSCFFKYEKNVKYVFSKTDFVVYFVVYMYSEIGWRSKSTRRTSWSVP